MRTAREAQHEMQDGEMRHDDVQHEIQHEMQHEKHRIVFASHGML